MHEAGLGRQDKMPSAAKVEEMKSDLTFKERQLESAQTTKTRYTSFESVSFINANPRLSMELAKRQAELEKVNTLDAKISVELGSLNTKMDTMQSDMEGFKNIDEMKDTHANTKQLLLRYKQQYIRRRDAMKSQVILLVRTLSIPFASVIRRYSPTNTKTSSTRLPATTRPRHLTRSSKSSGTTSKPSTTSKSVRHS